MRTSLRPLRHGACKRPASPAPSLPHRRLNHARAHEAAHWLCASGHRCSSSPAAAAPLRRPAKRPLAGLRLAGGYRVGCSTAPEAAPLALSLLLSPSRQRRLLPLAYARAYCPPPAPSASLTAPSATSNPACSRCSTAPCQAGVNRKRFNITAHYPKSASRSAQAALGGRPLRALSGSGNGLLCLAPPAWTTT